MPLDFPFRPDNLVFAWSLTPQLLRLDRLDLHVDRDVQPAWTGRTVSGEVKLPSPDDRQCPPNRGRFRRIWYRPGHGDDVRLLSPNWRRCW